MFKQKIKILVLLLVCLFLGGSKYFPKKDLPNNYLSGIITLRLRNAVWRYLDEKPIYQDLFLDFNCENNECESQVYGFAPKYNQDVEHRGKLELNEEDNAWNLTVNLKVRPSPFKMDEQLATYNIQLIPNKNNELIGSYTGTLNDRFLLGKVVGSKENQWIKNIPNHQPIKPQQHPRLAFRQEQLPELRNKAKTATGKQILHRLEESLKSEIFYDGYTLNGGSHAAGYCFLGLLNDDQKMANKGWEITEKSIQKSREESGKTKYRVLELSLLVSGIALAYDLCYPMWDEEKRKFLTNWLAHQGLKLTQGGGENWNNHIVSNWNVRARSGAGMALLAIKDEPLEFFPNNKFFAERENLDLFLATSTRKVKRFLDQAIGDRGFGTEGDLYTYISADIMLPFLQAYINVIGKDLVSNSEAAWLVPQSMMRMVLRDGKIYTPAYGRHRTGAESPLFSYGLNVLPPEFLPSTLWFFDRYFGKEGDNTFGVYEYLPHTAIYALLGYREEIERENPSTFLDKVMVDNQRGFYVFRNGWQDENDIVASIYLKQEPVRGGWAFPDVGSFRISGLGFNWAIAGEGDKAPENENSVYLPDSQPWAMSLPTTFVSNDNGSGVVSLITKELVDRKNKKKLQLNRSFAVDYSQISGAEAIFAVTDIFMGDINHSLFQNKIWTMHTEGKVTINGNKFTISSPSGASLQGIFVTPQQVKINYEKTKTGGKITATGGNRFFVVMTLQQDNPPPIEILNNFGINSTVQVGKQKIRYIGDRIVFEKF